MSYCLFPSIGRMQLFPDERMDPSSDWYDANMEPIQMANGNFGMVMETIIDKEGAHLERGYIPIQLLIHKLETYLSEFPDEPGDFTYVGATFSPETGWVAATPGEIERYLSRQAANILKACKFGMENGATDVTWR